MRKTVRNISACLSLIFITGYMLAATSLSALGNETELIHMQDGDLMLEVLGEVNNSASPAPLGSSIQFGYVSFIKGVDNIFSGAPQNESTARITFFTETATTRVTGHGPFSIVMRQGTTTLYYNSAPASFGTPDSFRSGTPIQVSTMEQQVIVDTVEKTFTVINLNTIESAKRFLLDSSMTQLGKPGEAFRTSLSGVLFTRSGGTSPPTGHFAGYAVGIGREDD